MSRTLSIALADEAATLALGAALAPGLSPGLIALHGDLGAGKTTLVRGILRGLGWQGRVKSPTYTLMERYPSAQLTISHWDLYRLGAPEELDALGFREFERQEELMLIEWPERGGAWLRDCDLEIAIDYVGAARCARLHARSERGERWLSHLAA